VDVHYKLEFLSGVVDFEVILLGVNTYWSSYNLFMLASEKYWGKAGMLQCNQGKEYKWEYSTLQSG